MSPINRETRCQPRVQDPQSLEEEKVIVAGHVSREHDTSTKSMQVKYENNNVFKNKPNRKSLPNLHSRESISAKTEGKSSKLKQRETANGEDIKATTDKEQASKTESVNPPELEDEKVEKNPTGNTELLANSAHPFVAENEVTLNGGDPDI
ncbi:hypothetical protein ACET3Z_009231 [Daucus carota]